MGSQGTDERNSLNVKTVKALGQIKVNFNFTCPQFYQTSRGTPLRGALPALDSFLKKKIKRIAI
jgi:hypothetical protein